MSLACSTIKLPNPLIPKTKVAKALNVLKKAIAAMTILLNGGLATAQYTDSIVVGSKCNAYREVKFPIRDDYFFYKIYLAGVLRETGFQLEHKGEPWERGWRYDSMITNYDAKGQLVNRTLRHEGSGLFSEQYINGELATRTTYISSHEEICETFKKGQLIKKTVRQFPFLLTINYDDKGGIADSITKHLDSISNELRKVHTSGDSTWYEYFNPTKELSSRSFWIGKRHIWTESYDEWGMRKTWEDSLRRYGGDILTVSKQKDTTWKWLKNGIHYFYFHSQKMGINKGYICDSENGKKIVYSKAGFDSVICYTGTNDTVFYEFWKENRIRTSEAIVRKGKENLYPRDYLSNMVGGWLEFAEETGKPDRSAYGISWVKLIDFYEDGSVKLITYTSVYNEQINNHQGYNFTLGELNGHDPGDQMPYSRKDLIACKYGIYQNGQWVIEPKYHWAGILKYEPMMDYSRMMFSANTDDSIYLFDNSGKNILTFSNQSYIELKKIGLNFCKKLGIEDSLLIECRNHGDVSYYTTQGIRVFHFSDSVAHFFCHSTNGYILQYPDSSVVHYADGTKWAILDPDQVHILDAAMNWVVVWGDDWRDITPGGTLYGRTGTKIKYRQYYKNSPDQCWIITDSTLLLLNVKTGTLKVLSEIDNGEKLANNFMQMLHEKSKNKKESQSLMVVTHNKKHKLFDFDKMEFIYKQSFDSIVWREQKFLRKGKWGMFSKDFSKIKLSGFDDVAYVYFNHEKAGYITRKGNKYMVLDTGEVKIIHEPIDQMVMVDDHHILLLLNKNKVLIESSQLLNSYAVKQEFPQRILWRARAFNLKTGSWDKWGIVSQEEVLVPFEYDEIIPVSADFKKLTSSYPDYALSFEMKKGGKNFHYNYFDGLNDLSNDFKLSDRFGRYQVALDKTGKIVSHSCNWNPDIPAKTTSLAFTENLLWTTTALPKDSTDVEYANGTWRVGVAENYLPLPDSFPSPRDYMEIQDMRVIKNKSGSWNVYDHNLKFLIQGWVDFDHWRSGLKVINDERVYYLSDNLAYYTSDKRAKPKVIQIPHLGIMYCSKNFYSFRNDSVWIHFPYEAPKKDSVLFLTPGHFDIFNSGFTYFPNDWEYEYTEENASTSEYIKTLHTLHWLSKQRDEKNKFYPSSPHFFPPEFYYAHEAPVIASDGERVNDSEGEVYYRPYMPEQFIPKRLPQPLKLSDFANYYLNVYDRDKVVTSGRFATFKFERDKTKNIFVSKNGDMYQFDLYALIDSTQLQAFSNYVFKKLSTYERLDFPCLPESDFVKYFNANFEINHDVLILKNSDKNEFRFAIEDLNPYLNKWVKENMFCRGCQGATLEMVIPEVIEDR